MEVCAVLLFSLRWAADWLECCDLQPLCRRLCRLSQPLPSLTHVTQLVRAVFCLSLHSDTWLSLHLKKLCVFVRHTDPLTIHMEQGSGVFCVVKRRENNRTDFKRRIHNIFIHTFSVLWASLEAKPKAHDATLVSEHVSPPLPLS